MEMARGVEIEIRDQTTGSGDTCRRILRTLPTWFGLPSSVEDYVATADRSPTVIASRGNEDVGLLTFVRHSEYAAEVYVMAVLPELHRHGIGRALGIDAKQQPAWSRRRPSLFRNHVCSAGKSI